MEQLESHGGVSQPPIHGRFIHTRPCSPQHIQLADLNDPSYQDDLSKFKDYWRRIIVTQIKMGNGAPSIDPELGPYPYKLSFFNKSSAPSSGSVADGESVNNGLDDQLSLLVDLVRGLYNEISYSS